MAWRICWKAQRTGAEGHCSLAFTKEVAQKMCDDMNMADADVGIVHWIEEVA